MPLTPSSTMITTFIRTFVLMLVDLPLQGYLSSLSDVGRSAEVRKSLYANRTIGSHYINKVEERSSYTVHMLTATITHLFIAERISARL